MKVSRRSRGGRLKGVPFGILLLVLQGLTSSAYCAGWQWIAPQRAHSLVRAGSGLWLVDVRGKEAFESSHPEGAVHIARENLGAKRLPVQKVMVLVDDSLGLKRGREAAELLLKNGQEKVYLLEGGMPAWQAEGLPVVARKPGRVFRSVTMDELQSARQERVPLRVFDLRDAAEQARGPVANAETAPGKDFRERLSAVLAQLKKDAAGNLAKRLEKPVTCILVFPLGVDARSLLERQARQVASDLRYLEGGAVAWDANPDKSLKKVAVCPTCPGSAAAGGKSP